MTDLKIRNLIVGTEESLPEQVQRLVRQFKDLWWSCDTSLPELPASYARSEQRVYEGELTRTVEALLAEMKNPPRGKAARQASLGRLEEMGTRLVQFVLGMEAGEFATLRAYGFVEAISEFARMARRFDPQLGWGEIFQAGRNVWSMNFMQLLLGMPVQITPAVFAYSMLYPYSDNYLDDTRVPLQTKTAFNARFRRRLMGEAVPVANRQEQALCDLVGMIEDQFERLSYPNVYQSLLAIHQAQGRSVQLAGQPASPYELDSLGILMEKGGTSVLADGYLVAGTLTPQQRELMFYYGTFTQLVDDLEDTQSDLQAGIQTIFTQTAQHWKLDGITNRTFHFGQKFQAALEALDTPGLETLKTAIRRGVPLMLIDSASRVGRYYNRPYLDWLQAHYPFRFGVVANQRKRIFRRRAGLAGLLEVLVRAETAA